MKMLGVKYF